MDVNFLRAADSVSPDPDVLLEQMVEYQNGLNSDYAAKLNVKINDRKDRLQGYLDHTHPGMNVPQDGPHFQFVMNALEEIAILSLELRDAGRKFSEYRTLSLELQLEIPDFITTTANDSSMTVKEKKVILEGLRDTVDTMAKMRLDYESESQSVILGCRKLMDMAEKSTDTAPGLADDPILVILRNGILHPSKANRHAYEFIVQQATMWRNRSIFRSQKMEEMHLKSISDQLKLLDVSSGVVGQETNSGGVEVSSVEEKPNGSPN